MHKIIIIILTFLSLDVFSQVEITWQTLSNVEFEDQYIESEDVYYYYPFFGSEVRDLAGKEVIITGYVLAIDPLKGYYVLSKGPFSSCFFCGVGGPESIMELNPVDTDTKFKMDEIVTFKGILNLNYDDIYRSNYILDEAEVYQW